MTETYVTALANDAILISLMLAGPVLLISLIIGSLISLVQAATQINEVTLSFIPKMIGLIVVLVVLGSWMLQQIMVFTANIFSSLPSLVKF
jgi:flagellar biosynthetic protein FliQ